MHYSARWRCCFQQQYLISTQPLVVAPFSGGSVKQYFQQRILTTQVEHSITGLDMRQESISQSLSLRSTFHQTSNIRDVQKRRYFTAKKENGTNIYKIVLSVHFVTLRTFFFCCNLFLNFQGRHQKALTSKSHQLRQSCTILSPPPIKGKFTTLFVFHIFALQFEVVSALTFIHKLTLFWGPTSSSKFEKWSFGTL